MKTYQVLAEIRQYFEVEAEDAEQAQLLIIKQFASGKLVIDEKPLFWCEEADLLEQ
jgi:hypothetical protein